jgi:hypothetical protein
MPALPQPIGARLQRGAISILMAMLLIAGVIFILAQTLGIMRVRGVDTAQSLDSSAAMMLAESGLERAEGILGAAVTGNINTDATCTAIASDGPFSVGRGTISYSSATSLPALCGGANPVCTSCTVTAKGIVGSTERDLTLKYNLGTVNGTTGRGNTITMVLKNTFAQPAIALFNLAWRRQGNGGNSASTLTSCTTSSSCQLLWNVESSNGKPSVGGLGTSVPIAGNTLSQTVTQTLDQSRDYSEVGALFPGLSGLPTVIGSYWSNTGTNETAINSGSSGATNSGTVSSGGGTCLIGGTVPNPPGNTTTQNCSNWCLAGDTLVLGLSGRGASSADETTAIAFNTTGTNGYAPQNVAMTRVVHFPNTDGSISNATGQVYSESWYAYNAAYNASTVTSVPSSTNIGPTTYSAAIFGVAGVPSLSVSNLGNNDTTGDFSGNTGRMCVGDTMTGSKVNSLIDAIYTGAGQTGTSITCADATAATPQTSGSFTLHTQTTGGGTTTVAVNSTSLKAISSSGTLATGSATILSGGTLNIASSPPAGGIYPLSSAANVLGYVVQGTGLSTTVTVGSSADLPATAGMIVQVYKLATGGTGALAANTRVTAITGANTFTLSAAPTTPLMGVQLCGGTCALFNEPSVSTASSVFTLTKSGGTSQFSAGFMCLSGVDKNNIIPVTSSAVQKRVWNETIQ